MTMVTVGSYKGEPVHKRKRMSDMDNGEVCFLEERGQYILCIDDMHHKQVHLILDSDQFVNTYSRYYDEYVRELYPDESITIKFL